VRGSDGHVLIPTHEDLVRGDVAVPGKLDGFVVVDVDGPPPLPYRYTARPAMVPGPAAMIGGGSHTMPQ
jgi:hypothetical protein